MNILDVAIAGRIAAGEGGGGGGGTDNYNDLSNLPQINGETLAGNKTAENLGLQDALTFDSAPTEDSTNPVESGGVYNALAGKQDNLTFDDDPTENSTNPVKSGGVYNALTGKQDNLTFDGVYNASTNKAATESTVTNAIAGLDVSAFSVDADETISSISETDGKISVTKQDIAIASNQVTAMTGYTKPSSAPATPAIQTSDTANQAFGKLEFKADTNQTNILYAINTGVKNILPVDSCNVSAATYLLHDYEMNVPAGDYIFYINVTSTTATGIQVITSIGADDGQHRTGAKTINLSSTSTGVKFASMTILSGTTCITLYVNNAANIPEIMLCPKQLWDTLDHTFQHGALPNYDLTRLESEDRAALAEVVDSGAKNLAEIPTTQTIGSITFTKDSNEWITSNSATPDGRQWSDANKNVVYSVKAGRYIIYGETASTNTGAIEAYVIVNGSLNQPLIITANSNLTVEVNLTSAGTIGLMYKPYSSNKVRYMICTKAAFGVSQKFVPYRVPITGLMSVVDKEVSCSSTLTTTGIKFTATEKAAYRITATAIYYNSIPMKLAIKHKIGSGSTQGTLCTAVHVENEDVSLTVSGIRLLDVGGEFEIFAQYASSTTNRFYVLVEKLG